MSIRAPSGVIKTVQPTLDDAATKQDTVSCARHPYYTRSPSLVRNIPPLLFSVKCFSFDTGGNPKVTTNLTKQALVT